jgi:hypothetical protein
LKKYLTAIFNSPLKSFLFLLRAENAFELRLRYN